MRELLTLFCALGCGLIAGFFYAFSVGLMKALGRLPPTQGIAAMQSINVVVINPWFLSVFLGTAVSCLVLLFGGIARWRIPGAPYLVAGSAFYLLGSFLVTMAFNVPRNNALAALAPNAADAQAQALWTSYLSTWTSWNHVRMLASLVASALFIFAFRSRV
jgi:uncharacterized membrane protein